jgi:hypothetical protein
MLIKGQRRAIPRLIENIQMPRHIIGLGRRVLSRYCDRKLIT